MFPDHKAMAKMAMAPMAPQKEKKRTPLCSGDDRTANFKRNNSTEAKFV